MKGFRECLEENQCEVILVPTGRGIVLSPLESYEALVYISGLLRARVPKLN